MKTQGYTAFVGRAEHLYNKSGMNSCSRESKERPLVVNSAGSFSTTSEFTSINPTGRLDYYLLYISDGALDVMFPDGYKRLPAGTLLLIPPNTPYKYSQKNGGSITYLWIHFTGSHVAVTLENYGFKLYPEYNTIAPDGTLITRFTNIYSAFAKNDRFRDNELSILLDRLLISFARRLEGNRQDGERQLTRSIAFINTHYSSELKIPELAKMENISVSRYNTVFRKMMGCSPTEHIAALRISSACDLLTGTDFNIKEIGEMVGYSDPHFFSKIFKKRTGLSPKDYRAGK